jgi:transcriptional regulator with XRE-family HTH domain
MMVDADELHREIGKRIRHARELSSPKLSQAKLAGRLGVSRASIVNIEAGRQHAPLHLLWRVAEALDMDLARLIPRPTELASAGTVVELNGALRREIKLEAGGDPALEERLTSIVGKLVITMERDPNNSK